MKKMTDETMREFLRQKEEYETLIGAAPDLLAALRDMLAEADKRITTSPLTRTKARAAISKATGEDIANHYRDDL